MLRDDELTDTRQRADYGELPQNVDQVLAAAREARRAKMTPHQRVVEDLIDQYTRAVKSDAVLDFFEGLAADIIFLKKNRGKHIQIVSEIESMAEYCATLEKGFKKLGKKLTNEED